MELKQVAKTHCVIFAGQDVFQGTTDECFDWMRDNKKSGRIQALPTKPLNPPTLKELNEWFESGFWKPSPKVKL